MPTLAQHLRASVPNALTCANLVCGCLCIWHSFLQPEALPAAALWLFWAAGFDFLDGFVARLLNAQSPLGRELDSLADVVSFGVAPAVLLFQLYHLFDFKYTTWPGIEWAALLIPVGSALRLARFNIDTRQTTYFIGVPTPANALMIATLPAAALSGDGIGIQLLFMHSGLFAGLCLVLSLLLLAPWPLFSAKSVFTRPFRLTLPLAFGLLGVGLVVWLGWMAGPLVFVLYLLTSLLGQRWWLGKLSTHTTTGT
jgi:CDP-diacylglycerol--serine O-phosphatidyltransferase